MPVNDIHIEESAATHVKIGVLLRCFRSFFTPYWKQIIATFVLALCAVGAELVLPVLVRQALDQHLTRAARRVTVADETAVPRPGQDDAVIARVDGLSFFLLPGPGGQIDPEVLRHWSTRGQVDAQRYYATPATPDTRAVAAVHPDLFTAAGSWLFIPYAAMTSLPEQDLSVIRAEDFRGITRTALLFLGVLLTSFLFAGVQTYLVEYTSQTIMHRIRCHIFDHLQGRSSAFFSRNPVGRLVTRATNDVQNLHEMFSALFASITKDVFMIAGILVVLALVSLKLTLVCFCLLPLLAAGTGVFNTLSRRAFRQVRIKVAALNARAQENFSGAPVVKAFCREGYNSRQFSGLNQENYQANMRQTLVFAVFNPLVDLVRLSTMALIIWYGGGQTLRATISIGTLVLFLYYTRMFFRPIQDLAEKYNIVQSAIASLERLYLLLNDTSQIPAPSTVRPMPEHHQVALAFQNVSFCYEPGEPVLQDVSFDVPEGKIVAVVGLTGAGKSTIINLIERFYDVGQGRILAGGVDIRTVAPDRLRSRMSLVMQDVFLFAGTLRDNITMGAPGYSDERIWQALTTVHADGVVRRLPRGLDEVLREGGQSLSAGERQLLSFARAVLRNTPVLLLDEATSNVDPLTEACIQKAMDTLLTGRTALIIAHRLSTIRRADTIIVLHKGRICEQGTHAELLARDQLYARLYNLHFSAARENV